jgi:GPH family glycoside/pentoside/hexuronide:cation symporter
MSIVGTFIGAGTVLPLVNLLSNTASGWRFMATIMGGICMGTTLITVYFVREPSNAQTASSYRSMGDFFRSYYSVLRLKAFRKILFPWVLNMAGTTMIQGVFLFYFTYVYGNDDIFKKALPFLMLSIIIFIPLWVQLSKRLGKKTSFCTGMTVFALALLLYSLFGHTLGVWFTFLIMGFAGFGSATQYVLPHSILPDVIEYDYAHNGVRREGVFYGIWTFSSKIGQALAILISGWILSLFNYVPNAVQTSQAQFGIKLLLGPIPVVMFILGVLILSAYPIDEAYYASILKKIEAREAEQTD